MGKLKTSAKSKLADIKSVTAKPEPKKETVGMVSKTKSSNAPTSFRLTEEDKNALRQIVEAVNDESRGKVSRDKIIQTLIHMGTKMPTSRIMKALGEIL